MPDRDDGDHSGCGLRDAVGVSDHGHAAASQLAPGDVDREAPFGDTGARWLPCDLTYRPSMWGANRGPASLVDVLIGNEEDFTACFGIEILDVPPDHMQMDVTGWADGRSRRAVDPVQRFVHGAGAWIRR